MELDCLVHPAGDLITRLARGNTTGQIRGVSRVIALALLDDDEEPMHPSSLSASSGLLA